MPKRGKQPVRTCADCRLCRTTIYPKIGVCLELSWKIGSAWSVRKADNFAIVCKSFWEQPLECDDKES